MKTLTKKAIVLASAIAVAGTFAVCAATYTSVAPAVSETDGKTVTVPFVTDVAGTDQITILAYYSTPVTVEGVTTTNETPDANNIVFIDQVQKDTILNDTITFSLRDTDPTEGTYTVLMGGTGVTTAGTGTFTLTEAPTNGTITGTVMGYNSVVRPTIVITGSNGSQEVLAGDAETYVAGEAATYSISLPAGTYNVDVTLKGHLTRTFANVTVAAGATNTLALTNLLGGDADASGFVDSSDMDYVNGSWWLGLGDDGYDSTGDIDGSDFVDGSDMDYVNGSWWLDNSAYGE